MWWFQDLEQLLYVLLRSTLLCERADLDQPAAFGDRVLGGRREGNPGMSHAVRRKLVTVFSLTPAGRDDACVSVLRLESDSLETGQIYPPNGISQYGPIIVYLLPHHRKEIPISSPAVTPLNCQPVRRTAGKTERIANFVLVLSPLKIGAQRSTFVGRQAIAVFVLCVANNFVSHSIIN